MGALTTKEVDLLKKLGISTDKLKKTGEKTQKVKKQKFIPTPKKHIRILTCLFCQTITVNYYVLQEIDLSCWEGGRVSKEIFMKTEALKGRTVTHHVNYCGHCPDKIRDLSEERVKKILTKLIAPEMWRII